MSSFPQSYIDTMTIVRQIHTPKTLISVTFNSSTVFCS